MLKLYNTLKRSVEDFIPINPSQVGMYTCGPTVYDYMHIGNLRTFVFSDILSRVLTYNGYQVQSVQNITDIDDKIINKIGERGLVGAAARYLAKEYEKYFLEDSKKLNILKMNSYPRATEYIPQMIDYIQKLINKGFAYVEKDGSVYFDISKFKNYGKLSGVQNHELKTGTRILSDNYEKENVQDFALWKAVKTSELNYDSPWGRGRPGWHIECSVMSQALLGATFDIHVGGVDLIFPHHENEIAQSEGKTGKKFVNYFVHGAHMLVDGKKMSKSLGNFFTLEDIEKKGLDPLALRYLYMQTHYRQEMNFTWEALEGAWKALGHLREVVNALDKPKVGCAEFEQRFQEAVNDDLNMPEALAVVWDLVKSNYPKAAIAQSLYKFDEVLGLSLKQGSLDEELIPEEIISMVEERNELRSQKRYHLADQMRNKIKKLGYIVQDTDGEVKIKKIDKIKM